MIVFVMFFGCRASGEKNDVIIKYNKRICAYYIV